MLSRFTPENGFDSHATWPSPYRMFWPSLSWLLLLAWRMSLADEVACGAATLSPPANPGLMSAATAYSAPMLLFSLKPEPMATVPGYGSSKLYDRFFL